RRTWGYSTISSMISGIYDGGGDIPLNGHAKGTVDDQLGKNTDGAGDTEQDSVVVGLGETIVLQENTRVGVNIGVRVLGLSVLGKNARSNLVDLADKLEHGILGEMLKSKLALRHVAGIGLAENSMAVTGNNLAGLESIPKELSDVLIRQIITN